MKVGEPIMTLEVKMSYPIEWHGEIYMAQINNITNKGRVYFGINRGRGVESFALDAKEFVEQIRPKDTFVDTYDVLFDAR